MDAILYQTNPTNKPQLIKVNISTINRTLTKSSGNQVVKKKKQPQRTAK